MKNPRLSGKSESESFETRYTKVQKCQYDKVANVTEINAIILFSLYLNYEMFFVFAPHLTNQHFDDSLQYFSKELLI